MKNRNLVFISSAVIAIVLISILFFSQESDSLSKQIIDKCELDVDCGINGLIEISETNDEKTVLEVFGELQFYYQENISKCKEYAPPLGKFLYYYYGDYEKPISIDDATCGQIYLGIIESYLVESENPDLIDITSICTEFPRQLDRENLECIHYLGHALYIVYENIYVAAERCNDFTINYEIMRCSSGVFMENLTSQKKLGFPYFKEDDLHYPCNSVSQEEFVRGCYSYQSLYIVTQQPNTSAKNSFDICDEVSEENKRFCYLGLGFMITANNVNDMNRIIELCQLGDERFHSECIKEAAFDLSDRKDVQQGMEFCKIAPDYTKEACYDGLGKWIILISDSEKEIEELCSQAENSKYSDICLDANWDTLL